MFLRILTLLLLPLLSGGLQAQAPATKVAVSFFAFNYAPGHETIHVRVGADAYEEVVLSKANIVGPITAIAGGSVLAIHGKMVNADGEEAYPVISSASLPAGASRVLVVLLPDPANAESPYRSLVFEHDTTKFPLGTYRVINLSSHPVRGAIGKDVVQAAPGAIANLQPKGEAGTIVPVLFEFYENERWNRLTETRAAIRDDRRWLMCIYQDPASRRMNIRTIPDRSLLAVPQSE